MKYFILIWAMMGLTFQAYGQTSSPTLLYPQVYEVITIAKEAVEDIQSLTQLGVDHSYALMETETEIKLLKAHPQSASTQLQQQVSRKLFGSSLGRDHYDIKFYGWEYLPAPLKHHFLNLAQKKASF